MLTMTDLFCGAGGSSTGAISVPGVSVRMAANHWTLAIETHNTNHPTTDHACADISQVDPRLFPRTDILWASPECTNHSVAKGVKRNLDATPDLFGEVLPDAAADRSRATMWDVPRFAEHHQYKAIITENVVDAAKWIMFPAWLQAMELLGYRHRIVYLNSMHAQAAGLPAPQSRDRMYVVFWLKGNAEPDLDHWTRPTAYCSTCDETVTAIQGWKKPSPWGRYRTQYVWRCPRSKCRNSVVEPGWLPAAAAIDWTIKGQRIGDRTKPLAPKTLARIEAGLAKFSNTPFLSQFRERVRNLDPATEPLTTIVADGANHGLIQPGLLVPVEGRDGKEARMASEPMRTMTTRNETAFVVPLRANNTPKSVTEPYDTFAANGNHHALAQAETPKLEDCLFRMLEPQEIARGMAFPDGYSILGNKREQVRQAGNAVTPPAARDLVSAVADSLGVVA